MQLKAKLAQEQDAFRGVQEESRKELERHTLQLFAYQNQVKQLQHELKACEENAKGQLVELKANHQREIHEIHQHYENVLGEQHHLITANTEALRAQTTETNRAHRQFANKMESTQQHFKSKLEDLQSVRDSERLHLEKQYHQLMDQKTQETNDVIAKVRAEKDKLNKQVKHQQKEIEYLLQYVDKLSLLVNNMENGKYNLYQRSGIKRFKIPRSEKPDQEFDLTTCKHVASLIKKANGFLTNTGTNKEFGAGIGITLASDSRMINTTMDSMTSASSARPVTRAGKERQRLNKIENELNESNNEGSSAFGASGMLMMSPGTPSSSMLGSSFWNQTRSKHNNTDGFENWGLEAPVDNLSNEELQDLVHQLRSLLMVSEGGLGGQQLFAYDGDEYDDDDEEDSFDDQEDQTQQQQRGVSSNMLPKKRKKKGSASDVEQEVLKELASNETIQYIRRLEYDLEEYKRMYRDEVKHRNQLQVVVASSQRIIDRDQLRQRQANSHRGAGEFIQSTRSPRKVSTSGFKQRPSTVSSTQSRTSVKVTSPRKKSRAASGARDRRKPVVFDVSNLDTLPSAANAQRMTTPEKGEGKRIFRKTPAVKR
eukprot:TRINITY_DN5606_c0_g1_i1.p1 TRINITY_DN5606_c0_g1~~TRINITY_DN5606_c0_g1_i1.p1  ORF type:complete len:606 (-),score=254.46 TRINITY_DN5606_c0_g1_i1:16-1806(-)